MKDSTLKRMIRVGKISAVNVERMMARVVFEDKDDETELVSAELPILSIGAGNNKVYFNYRVGESVVCLFPNNTDDGSGFILGSFNHDQSELRANDLNKTRIDLGDKATIEFDESTGDLNITIKGDINIITEKNLNITTSEKMNVNSSADIIMHGQNIRLN